MAAELLKAFLAALAAAVGTAAGTAAAEKLKSPAPWIDVELR